MPASPDHYLISANGLLGSPPLSAPSEAKRIIEDAFKSNPANGLVLHFHGGLVSRDYALSNIVGRLTDIYQSAKAYPLFFVWESGFTEAIWNNKTDLVKDPAFRELVKKVSEWVLKKFPLDNALKFKGAGNNQIDDINHFRESFDKWFDGVDDVTEPPTESTSLGENRDPNTTRARATDQLDSDTLANEINNDLVYDRPFKERLYSAYLSSQPQPQPPAGVPVTALDAAAVEKMFPSAGQGGVTADKAAMSWILVAKFVATIVIAVIKRYRSGSDHGLYCTVVEEVLRSAYGELIGGAVWNQMKKDTLDSFGANTASCGSAVLNELLALERENKRFKKITLVGHSTGAIYICNLLDAARALGLSTPIEVVFLAPAITCKRFASAIQDHGKTSLAKFHMFAMKDERETADAMLKPLYTRSLLYFVSGLLEGDQVNGAWNPVIDYPLVGMERFYKPPFSDAEPVKTVVQFMKDKPYRAVWSTTTGADSGLNSDAGHHGDFDDDEMTLESLVALIRAD